MVCEVGFCTVSCLDSLSSSLSPSLSPCPSATRALSLSLLKQISTHLKNLTEVLIKIKRRTSLVLLHILDTGVFPRIRLRLEKEIGTLDKSS